MKSNRRFVNLPLDMLINISLAIVFLGIGADSTAVNIYNEVSGLNCVRPQFSATRSDATSKLECASLCDQATDCQAFSVADGPCQLFVFNRCSKYVRDCSCNRTARVFVKQLPGLAPGALCPAGFADAFCGSKYKAFTNLLDWFVAKDAIDALPGLTIMADVVDQAEMNHQNSIFARDNLARVLLGGWQPPGSPEPSGGFVWASCNASIDLSLFAPGEPNNSGGVENFVLAGAAYNQLNDNIQYKWYFSGALAKCTSPFN